MNKWVINKLSRKRIPYHCFNQTKGVLTKQIGQVRSYSNFTESGNIKVIIDPVSLRLQENWLKISVDVPPFDSLKFKYKAPSFINHGDCRISRCSARIFDLKFLPFTEQWTYIKMSPFRKSTTLNFCLRKMQSFAYFIIFLKNLLHSNNIHHGIFN